jgi:hypothetical protein
MYKKIRPPACTPELKLEKSYLIWGWQTSSKLHFGTTIGARLMGLSLLKKNRWHVLPMLSLGMEGVPVLGRETIDCEKICLIAFWQHTGQAGPAVHVDPTCHPSVELGNTHEGIGDIAMSHELVDSDFDRHGRRPPQCDCLGRAGLAEQKTSLPWLYGIGASRACSRREPISISVGAAFLCRLPIATRRLFPNGPARLIPALDENIYAMDSHVQELLLLCRSGFWTGREELGGGGRSDR